MKRILRACLIFLAVLMLGILPLFDSGAAVAQTAGGKPLVIIRFNQERVYYDQQLFSALTKAVEAKPEVLFDVVSYSPATGQAKTDAQWQAAASSHTKSVVASLQSMGVPASRIQVSGQQQPGLRYDETHIFVR